MKPETQLDKPITLGDLTRVISENNVVLLNAMDEKIVKNNDVLIPLIDKKIKDNNDILIPLIDKKIKDNNDILIPLIDKKIKDGIKDNNEYIFENFNDQTDRILMNFKGLVRFRGDGSFVVNL